jgi:formate dehydrogenase alpha subunit
VAGLAATFGSGAMTNSIDELEYTDLILATGTNTTENHPVIGMKVKRAVRQNGTKLIVIDPREIDLVKYADIWLRQKPGTDVAVFNGLLNVIIAEGLYAKEYVTERTEGFDALKKVVEKYTPAYVEKISGIPAEDLKKAARMYAGAKRASIIYAMGITQHISGTDNVKSTANLSMLCGNVGIEGGGVNPLRGQNNVQGACDMGGLPNVYPAYQQVANEDICKKFEAAWNAKLSPKPGLTLMEMMAAAGKGDIKAIYIMGENPLLSDPDLQHVKKELKKLDLLIVQDLFMTETAQLADVVLPVSSFAEKEGTFTNTERRVQRVRKAIEAPGETKTDWEVICGIANKMGYAMNYSSAKEIFEEVVKVTPSYAGISYERLEKQGIQWPCPTSEHQGTRFLHKDKFSRGLGLFTAIEFIPPDELPNKEYPFLLSTGRVLYHYHTGTMTTRSKGLSERYPESLVEINPVDADKLGISEGQKVKVTSRRGSAEAKATITQKSAPGSIFMNFHFADSAVNNLTNPVLDPTGKIPEYKVCAVKLEAA